MEDTTSDFVYVRLHGGSKLYVSVIRRRALKNGQKKSEAGAKVTPSGTRFKSTPSNSRPKGRDIFCLFR